MSNLSDVMEHRLGTSTALRRASIGAGEALLPLGSLAGITYTNESSGLALPPCSAGDITVVFFKNEKRIWHHAALDHEYQSRGLVPVHPLALGKVCAREMRNLWFSAPVTFCQTERGTAFFKLTTYYHDVWNLNLPTFLLKKLQLPWWPSGTLFAGTPKPA